MIPANVKIIRQSNYENAFKNLIYISANIKNFYKSDYLKINHKIIYKVEIDEEEEESSPYIILSKIQRDQIYLIKNIEPVENIENIKAVDLLISPLRSTDTITIDNFEFINAFILENKNLPLFFDQKLFFNFNQDLFILTVTGLQAEKQYGIVSSDSKITIHTKSDIAIVGKEIDIYNLVNLGIGGLKEEFAQMFRRAFIQRTLKKELINELGISHARGIILYGPPGTGKTLIARQIGSLLNSRKPKVVNGPEILNKYVGQSEENIRMLFREAEEEGRMKGEDSLLHIIIFDEIDAICKQRTEQAQFGDQIVNQLLAKMDGVDQLNNILVIGLTNRIDLIDNALLRPGRFEIKIEIGLPKESDRREIFDIHMSSLIKNNRIENIDYDYLIRESNNYTGAEIEAVVKSAISFSLERNKDEPIINMNDIKDALREIKPAFGAVDLFTVDKYYALPSFNILMEIFMQNIEKSRKNKLCNILSLLVYGNKGTGKRTFIKEAAKKSNFGFIKILKPKDLIGLNEIDRIHFIKNIFNDAYRCEESLILIEDIENIIDYVAIGPRFSNIILQALKVFIREQPVKNKLLIFASTSEYEVINEMNLIDSFDEAFEMPLLKRGDIEILKEDFDIEDEDFTNMPIKALISHAKNK